MGMDETLNKGAWGDFMISEGGAHKKQPELLSENDQADEIERIGKPKTILKNLVTEFTTRIVDLISPTSENEEYWEDPLIFRTKIQFATPSKFYQICFLP